MFGMDDSPVICPGEGMKQQSPLHMMMDIQHENENNPWLLWASGDITVTFTEVQPSLSLFAGMKNC